MPTILTRSSDARAELVELTNHYIRQVMLEVCYDSHDLALVVERGASHWRNSFLRAFRGFPVNDDIANRIFAFFCRQFLTRHLGQSPRQVLDTVAPEEPVRPPTEDEIAKGWEIESASSEAGRKFLYGDQHPVEAMRRELDQLTVSRTVH